MNLEPLVKGAMVWFLFCFLSAGIVDGGGEIRHRVTAVLYLVCGFGGAILMIVAGIALRVE